MKIIGVEGMSPENIRDEVNRGGRLVIYTYCVSILVMTFKRPADIRLIKAGHSPAAASWPWVALSLVLGWWGFPWGPIYTIETIYRNLCGGIDVTDDVLRQILPPPPLAQVPNAARAAVPVSAPPLLHTPPAPARGFNLKAAGMMAGAICLIVLAGLSVYCFQQAQDLTVVLTSGLKQPYSVQLNGETYKLSPYEAKVLHLSEGEFNLQDVAGGKIVGAPQTFTFAIPFFSHLGTSKVAVINPDRAALFFVSEVPYYNKKSGPPPKAEDPVYTVLANQPSYFIAKPDYVIEQADQDISMPSGTTRLVKTRLENAREPHLSWSLNTLVEKNGYPAAREHAMIQARYFADEDFLNSIVNDLHPEDMPAFFKLRLAERPVLVDWHRFYQRSREVNEPGHDLAAEYRAYLQAEPDNGALMYLLGRQISDDAEAQRLWQQAIAATPPCPYAYGAMGYDAMSEGRFADALDHYRAAEKAGIGGGSRKQYRREALWALGQADVLLAELAAERQADPLDLSVVDQQIRATLALKHDPAAAAKLKAAYLAAYKKATGGENQDAIETYLQTHIAYELDDMAAYAKFAAQAKSADFLFSAAISQGDLKGATAALGGEDKPGSRQLLLLYILTKRQGDAAAAEELFQKAITALKSESFRNRQIAGALAADAPDAAAICAMHLDVDEKRILLTALGVRDPAHQATYFELARKLNYSTDYPHRFLRAILTPPV